MLSIIGIWAGIILCGVNLGMSLSFIPKAGHKGDWLPVWLVAPAMVGVAVVLSVQLGSVLS